MVQPILFLNYKILNNYKNINDGMHINSTQQFVPKEKKIIK